ncbi:MAG: hypothetical protein K1V84_02885, partial [Muribaculaceae bacterium]
MITKIKESRPGKARPLLIYVEIVLSPQRYHKIPYPPNFSGTFSSCRVNKQVQNYFIALKNSTIGEEKF